MARSNVESASNNVIALQNKSSKAHVCTRVLYVCDGKEDVGCGFVSVLFTLSELCVTSVPRD